MYKKHKRKKGRGVLLGSDWSKIYRNLQPYLRRKKQKGGNLRSYLGRKLQKGGTWWGYKKLFGIK